MLAFPQRITLLVMLFVLLNGCANLGTAQHCNCETAKAQLSKQRLMLSEGYSLLYSDATHMDLAGMILYVKAESDAVDAIVTNIAEFAARVKKDLERIAKDYPGVRIDLDPLPEMEKRKRSAIAKDRARYFAPVVGHGGREYERTMLIGYANGLIHEFHLCQVLAEAETDINLKKFLLDTGKQYEALYERTNALLEKEYFRDPNGRTK